MMLSRPSSALTLCMLLFAVIPLVTSDHFRDLSFIQTPDQHGQVRIISADSFSGVRVTWLFPSLPLSRSGNISGWVFRVDPPLQPWTAVSQSVPSFDLWQENTNTPDRLDYHCEFCNMPIAAVEVNDENYPSVYKQTLTTPISVDATQSYILGIRLPPPGDTNLNLSFQYVTNTTDEVSFFFNAPTLFVTIGDTTYKDNKHVPLVSPLYAVTTAMGPSSSASEEHPLILSTPPLPTITDTAADGSIPPVIPSTSSGSTGQPTTTPTSVPSLTPPTADSSSNQTSFALIIASLISALVLLILCVLGLVLLLKYCQLKIGKGSTQLDNPTYHVAEYRTHTGKSTQENGAHGGKTSSSIVSYHATATPAPVSFLSASLPPLPSHQVSPHIPPPLTLHHYEVDETRPLSHVYDQPRHKQGSMSLPVPYEIPLAPSHEISSKHHVYSELECGDCPSLPSSATVLQQEVDKKSLISSSQSSSIFDNSIYKDPNNLVSSTDGAVGGSDDLYWKPASSSRQLYDQLSNRKFKEILRDSIKLTDHLGSGHFGTVNKGVWHSLNGPVAVAVKQLQLGATELDRVRFLQEAAIMGQFSHPNVVTLHGVVTKDDPIMIVLEYMPNGDLRNCLLKLRPLPHEEVSVALPLLLLRFCQEIATGMSYLSKKAFVHRDLAARNILLDKNSTCKIGDFGMSRDLMDSNYYITHGGIIPVKWTAPEALHYKKYSTASDVWSFGCLMYEIWSLGHKPFEQCNNMDCIQLVIQGYRLPPPAGCCRALYKLMILCWHTVPSQRPVFPEMQHVLTHLNAHTLERVDPQLGRLGGPLEAGDGVYPDLQDYYLQDQTEPSSDSR